MDTPGKDVAQSGHGVDWRAVLESLFPVHLDELDVINGCIHFRNYSSDPAVDLVATKVDVVVRNLSNALGVGARYLIRHRGAHPRRPTADVSRGVRPVGH